MKPTEKQKCIAEQAVYGDLRLYKKNVRLVDFYTFDPNNPKENDKAERCGFLVGLRPLSDLTKEITHKGYNSDEPFIPLVELAKKTYLETDAYYTVESHSEAWGVVEVVKLRDVDTNEVFTAYCIEEESIKTKEADLLHLWHFDTRNLIATGEAIDVNTLDVNHYSVKL